MKTSDGGPAKPTAEESAPATAVDRKQLANVRKLLGGADWATVLQGLELVEALNDVVLWDTLAVGLAVMDGSLLVSRGCEIDKRVRAGFRDLVGYVVMRGAGRHGDIAKVDLREVAPADLRILKGYSGLQTLCLRHCYSLTSLEGIEGLTALATLDLSACKSLTSLKGIEGLTALTTLDLWACKSLTSLKGIEGLTALTALNLSDCSSLTSLKGIEGLTALTTLDLSYCNSLTSLKGIEGLTALTTLDLWACKSLTSLKGIEGLTALTALNLSDCSSLSGVPGGLQEVTRGILAVKAWAART